MELNESADVGVDVSAPHNGHHGGFEVVLGEDHVSAVLGDRDAGAHSETDIGRAQGVYVVDAFSGDGNGLTHVTETNDQEIFVVGSGSSHNSKVAGYDFLEVFFLFEDELYVTFGIVFLSNTSN